MNPKILIHSKSSLTKKPKIDPNSIHFELLKLTLELENPEPVKNSNWHFLEVFLSKLDIFSRFQKKIFSFFSKNSRMKIFPVKNFKKAQINFRQKRSTENIFYGRGITECTKNIFSRG